MTSPSPQDDALGRATMRRVNARLVPLLCVLYFCNYLDRTNLGIAALQMNRDLRFTATVYGLRPGLSSRGGSYLTNGDREQIYKGVTLAFDKRLSHGFLANGHRTEKLALCRQLLAAPQPSPLAPRRWQDRLRDLTGEDVDVCPCCGGRMLICDAIPPRPSTWYDSS